MYVATRAALNGWRHLTAVSRTYYRNPNLEAERYGETLLRISAGGDAERGGTGVEVALLGGQQIMAFVEEGGLRWEDIKGQLLGLDEWGPGIQSAVFALCSGRWDVFEATARSLDRQSERRGLARLLGVLGGIAVLADPDGTRRTLILDGSEPKPWSAPPRRVAEWRRQLLARTTAPEAAENLARSLPSAKMQGAFPEDRLLDAARAMCEEEAARLRTAALFHVDADACAVATRKATRPRKAPLNAGRVPAPAGMLVLETPVDWAPLYPPLVTAVWGLNQFSHTQSWWLTLYGHAADSPPMVQISFTDLQKGLVFADHETFSGDAGDAFATRAVVACWDLITQERVGKPVVDIEVERRQPKRLRADRRLGITDDSAVRAVGIRGRRSSTPRPRRPEDAGGSGRRYDRGRWWVGEHGRNHCMNPALHAAGGCTHEDITILNYAKGPEGAPFLDTVRMLKGADLRAAL